MDDATEPAPSSIKPLVTTGMVLPFLQDYFNLPIQNLEAVEGGQVSQTFSFSVGPGNAAGVAHAQDYIIRFNPPMSVNFEKEAYASEKFASPTIPIPRVIQLGRLAGINFAITEKLPGQNLAQISGTDYLALIPRLMEVLDAIHQIPVLDKPGYGIFDGSGVAPAASWTEHLESVLAEEPEGGFFGSWHDLFHRSFLDQKQFEFFYHKMLELSRYSTQERSLVHGDYGFGNVLVQDGSVTAVLDWMNARYGDFLYDVAWLDFWAPQDRWHERFQQYYQHAKRTVPFYTERLLCCQCYITLDGMRFFAKAGSKQSYDFVTDRMISLLRDHGL